MQKSISFAPEQGAEDPDIAAARKSSGAIDNFLARKLSVSEKPPRTNPFDNPAYANAVVTRSKRSYTGSALLFVSLALAVLRILGATLVTGASLLGNIFVNGVWAAFFAVVTGVLVVTVSYHAVFLYKALTKDDYFERKGLLKHLLVPTLVQMSLHLFVTVAGPLIFPVAFIDISISPVWVAVPATMFFFLCWDTAMLVLLWRRIRKPAGLAGRVIRPFKRAPALPSTIPV